MNNPFKELEKLEELAYKESQELPQPTNTNQQAPSIDETAPNTNLNGASNNGSLTSVESEEASDFEKNTELGEQDGQNSKPSNMSNHNLGFRPRPFLGRRILDTQHMLVTFTKFIELTFGNIFKVAEEMLKNMSDDDKTQKPK